MVWIVSKFAHNSLLFFFFLCHFSRHLLPSSHTTISQGASEHLICTHIHSILFPKRVSTISSSSPPYINYANNSGACVNFVGILTRSVTFWKKSSMPPCANTCLREYFLSLHYSHCFCSCSNLQISSALSTIYKRNPK